MKGLLGLVFVAALMFGSVTPVLAQAAPTTEAFTGEVWTWDEQASTVTLRQGTRTIRVKVDPKQFIGLQLHQNATIRGQLVPPGDIQRVTVPHGPIVPKGAPDELEVTGTIATVEPTGILTIDIPRGPLVVWGAPPASSMFKRGDPVRVRIRVQPMEVGPATPGQTTSSPTPEVSASPPNAPGDYAVVLGAINALDPAGRIRVESPRGAISVSVPSVARYRVSDVVEVRTEVRPAK